MRPTGSRIPLTHLKSAKRLVRGHSARKKQIVQKSLEEQGLLDPVTINDSNVIIDGHLRVEIARKLGWREISVVRLSHLSDAELRAHAIAANQLPGVATVDPDALRLELEEISFESPKLDLTLTGFSIPEMDRIAGRHTAKQYDDLSEDIETDPKDQEAPVSQSGDMYQLCEHKIICGDSLNADVLAKLMGDDEAQMIFTDPPYNVPVEGHVTGSNAHEEFAFASGEMSSSEFAEFLEDTLMAPSPIFVWITPILTNCFRLQIPSLNAASTSVSGIRDRRAWDHFTGLAMRWLRSTRTAQRRILTMSSLASMAGIDLISGPFRA